MGAQESEDVTLGLQDSNKLTLTWQSGLVPNLWKELKNRFQPDDGLSEMSMEGGLHMLKFTKKEDPKNLALKITHITMVFKVYIPNSKKLAHNLRFG